MVLTVICCLLSLGYLLLRVPDPNWYLTGGLITFAICTVPAFYMVWDSKYSRPVLNNLAAPMITGLCILASEVLLSIPYDLLRIIMSPWPAAMAPLAFAIWISYRNDPLKGIF